MRALKKTSFKNLLLSGDKFYFFTALIANIEAIFYLRLSHLRSVFPYLALPLSIIRLKRAHYSPERDSRAMVYQGYPAETGA